MVEVNLDKIFAERWVEQCKIGARWLIDYVDREIKPEVYLEVGCAKLGTLFMHQHLLPDNGLAIGIDVNDAPEWEGYTSPNGSDFVLLQGDSASDRIIEGVKDALGDRKIDFLFIDGDHDIDPVQKDWDNYSPLVREGGLIAFHDYDRSAYFRGVKEGQGAVWTCARLEEEGYKIMTVPAGSIGVAFVRKH
jgi:predicted O-methyltransferase YrrM